MKYNRTCNYCGDKYYVCNYCTEINSWKNICCSRECYRKMVAEAKENQVIKPKKIDLGTSPAIIVHLFNGTEKEVVGYDLDLGRFDLEGNLTVSYDDIKFFKISKDEFLEIFDYVKSKNR